jgi:hypothetical protein
VNTYSNTKTKKKLFNFNDNINNINYFNDIINLFNLNDNINLFNFNDNINYFNDINYYFNLMILISIHIILLSLGEYLFQHQD